jgi:hypothetical protein
VGLCVDSVVSDSLITSSNIVPIKQIGRYNEIFGFGHY